MDTEAARQIFLQTTTPTASSKHSDRTEFQLALGKTRSQINLTHL